MSKKRIEQSKLKRDQCLACFGRISKFFNNFDKTNVSKQQIFEIKTRLERLSSIWDQFDAVQNELESISGFEEEVRVKFENDYFTLYSQMQETIDDFKNKDVNSTSSSNNIEQNSSKDPVLLMKLPTFSGEYHEWVEFRDSFISLVDSNSKLSNIQKFYHLKSCLKADVLETIKAITVSNDNYPLAWQQLIDRYEKTHLIANSHVNAILNFPQISKDSSKALRGLHNAIVNNLKSLKNLNVPVEHWDLLLIPIISTKLDTITFREWERFSVEKKNVNLQNLLNIISNKADYLEQMENKANVQSVQSQPNIKSQLKVVNSKRFSSNYTQYTENTCKICNGTHPVFRCIPFLKLSIEERIKKVKDTRLCFNCLKASHSANQCPSSKCKKCGKLHNTLLHLESDEKPNLIHNSKTDELSTIATTQTHSKGNAMQVQVILPTAIISVVDTNNQWHQCRALLDCGAMSSFISREFHNKLKLPIQIVNCSIKGVGNSIQTAQHQSTIKFSPVYGKRAQFETKCFILDKITSNLPLLSFNQNSLQIPHNIALADPTFNRSGQVDILLGSAVFWELLENGQIKIQNTQLSLQKTKLGWIVGGLTRYQNKTKSRAKQTVNCTAVSNLSLEESVRKFWEIEEVSANTPMSYEERICEDIFIKTHTRDLEGRFIVKIPFKSNVIQLGNSRHLALRRFKYLEKRLLKNQNLRAEYVKIMKEYVTMDHMRLVNEPNELERVCYYIPHHSVQKESLTTKVRVVFDASMPTTSGLSLNDVQLVGPTIQNELFEILVNFRLHKYVMTSDISKMYRMVKLHEEHKAYHRIFWRENPEESIKCYELQTVTFGTASAPFLAIRCLHQLAIESEKAHPRTSEIIKNNFYVDDLIYGAETIEELLQTQHEITKILSSAGFHLRKWLCNDQRVYDKLKLNPDIDCNTLQFGDSEQKTLGIAWNTKSDQIFYSNRHLESKPVTKRVVLSELSKIFDPLGLVGPILIVGKLLMQSLWQEQISWDEPIPSELSDRWLEFKNELNNIASIKIQRKVLINDYEHFELHGFCDASQKAYGACIFLRSQNKQGIIFSQLLCSKSRVAPLKTISLPRLELSAALLLGRLVNKVLSKIEIKPTAIHLWSDSTITLCWIRGNPSKWKTFVSNRVGEIQQITDINDWHHVQSAENPADILSRGASATQLMQSQIWWSGPSWFQDPLIKYEQPLQTLSEIPEEKTVIHLVIESKNELIERFSSFEKLLRTTAYCIRFKDNCKLSKDQRRVGDLSVSELKRAKSTLLKVMQRQSFPQDYKNLLSSKPLHKQSRLLLLNPFLDNEQVIRVGGRLSKIPLSFDTKHPVIMSPCHTLTKLIVKQIHCENFHCGPSALLSFVRQTFWPIDGRNLVKGIVRGCRVCFLAKPKPCQYMMGQLPACRATKSFPFENVGVDYAGPILIKDRKTRNYKTLKAYVCLFICMSTKAIHLECVSDLSTEAFILCLKRFISRRGKPSNIFSDNAKNFVGTNIEIKRLYNYIHQHSQQINKFLANQEINWHFIPARSPNFGGIWEAGIKSVKAHLNKVTRNLKFDFEQLNTLLCQIEGIINSRPLTALSSDPADPYPLTPAHFLMGRSVNQHPEISNPSSVPISRIKQYKHLETIITQFWHRWSRDYLHQLQVQTKWRRNLPDTPTVKVGQLVLLKEGTQPFQWPLGRITELHPGQDGIVRVVSVRVRNGTTKRGLTNICILPDMV